jgi:hypothetical protein
MQNLPTFTIAFEEGSQLPIGDYPTLTFLARTHNYITETVVGRIIQHLA